jgi:hypothetical protein
MANNKPMTNFFWGGLRKTIHPHKAIRIGEKLAIKVELAMVVY